MSALPGDFGPALVFSGSGDFHHVTPILLERAIRAAGSPPVTLLHFDNHPDWVTFGDGAHCGSWVGQAARLPQVVKVLTVGVCSRDLEKSKTEADLSAIKSDRLELYPYRAPRGAQVLSLGGREWSSVEAMGEAAFADFLPGRISTTAVYVTIDKDVLHPADAGTNWDQGLTTLAYLKTLLGKVARDHDLIGADVVGDWSRPVYGGGLVAAALKRGEALLDQPWRSPAPERREANQDVNLELLTLIGELAR